MSKSKNLRVEPLSRALGAEVFGVDLARPIRPRRPKTSPLYALIEQVYDPVKA